MRQKFDLTQAELEETAEKAVTLQNWLQEKSLRIVCRTPIPLEATLVTSVVIATGALVLMDGELPAGFCWGGFDGCKIG
jgi:hypothetical protein